MLSDLNSQCCCRCTNISYASRANHMRTVTVYELLLQFCWRIDRHGWCVHLLAHMCKKWSLIKFSALDFCILHVNYEHSDKVSCSNKYINIYMCVLLPNCSVVRMYLIYLSFFVMLPVSHPLTLMVSSKDSEQAKVECALNEKLRKVERTKSYVQTNVIKIINLGNFFVALIKSHTHSVVSIQ